MTIPSENRQSATGGTSALTRKKRTVWRWFGVPGLLSLLLMVVLFWLTATQTGFASLWRLIGLSSGGQLAARQVEGTLWQGFQLQDLVINTASDDIRISSLQLDWHPAALWHGELWISRLQAGLVKLTPKPNAPPSAWPSLPVSLVLPFAVRLDALTVAALSVARQETSLVDLAMSYRFDGQQHRLRLQRVQAGDLALSAQLRLTARAPFALAGRVALGMPQGQGELHLAGNLSQLQLDGQARTVGQSVDISGQLAPFDRAPYRRIQQLHLKSHGLNPQQIRSSWPKAVLDIEANIKTVSKAQAKGTLRLTNRAAGVLPTGHLPLKQLQATFAMGLDSLQIDQLQAQLTQGRIGLTGQISQDAMALESTLDGVSLKPWVQSAPDPLFSGKVTLSGRPDQPVLQGHLKGKQLVLDARLLARQAAAGDWSLAIEQAQLQAGHGVLQINGQVSQAGGFQLVGQLVRADPRQLQPGWPKGDINADLRLSGHWSTATLADLALNLRPSQLNGAALAGQLQLRLNGLRLENIKADLNLAGNTLLANGAWGRAGDRVYARIQAPDLNRLGFGLRGRVEGELTLSGSTADPSLAGSLQAQQLRFPGLISAEHVEFTGALQAGPRGRLNMDTRLQGVSGPGWQLASLTAGAHGTRAQHRISLAANLSLANRPWALGLVAQGSLAGSTPLWRGTVLSARIDGKPSAVLMAPLPIELGAAGLALGRGRLMLAGGQLQFDQLVVKPGGTVISHGRLDGLPLVALEPWLPQPAIRSLVLSAAWNVQANGQGTLHVAKSGGDVSLDTPSGPFAMGLQQAQLDLDWSQGRTRFALKVSASKGGQLSASGAVGAILQQMTETTVLSGKLVLQVPALDKLAPVMGGAEVGGQLNADLAFSGPIGRLQAHGKIDGQGLLWRDGKTGIRLSDGQLTARLEGQTLFVDRLRFASGQGEAVASGQVALGSGLPKAGIRVDIRQFGVFDRPDRRLVVSGHAILNVSDQLMSLTGEIRADQGRLTLPEAGAPALSDDVHIVGQPPAQSALASMPVAVDLTLDLGDDFVFKAPGLQVTLRGKVRVCARPGQQPTAIGQVRVVKGSYKAYGQDLTIEVGSITFVGPLDNPNLDIRARRRLSPVGAGIEVQGSVQAPRLQLIANDAMTDREKLSWLVLGRAPDDTAQDSNFLAMAAGAFAAGSLNDQLGLFDDFGMSRRASKTAINGTVSPAEQVLTVGKQLTQTFYLGYEYGLTSSQQALKLVYQLSSKWSLLLRIGVDTSVETRYTRRFD